MSPSAWPLLSPFFCLSRGKLTRIQFRRVGKGAFAPCPPSRARSTLAWWARFALPTLRDLQSMQPEHPVDRAQFGGLDQPGMRDRDGKQRAIKLFLPEGEEILQRREFRKQIVILPDIGLQQ